MHARRRAILSMLVAAFGLAAPRICRAVDLRLVVDQKGDFVVVGNTLGYDCFQSPSPLVGTVADCGMFLEDNAPDVFWRSDEPAAGQALGDISVSVSDARSSAVLQLPAGASVTHALLYWGGVYSSAPDMEALFERPGAFSQMVTAVDSSTTVPVSPLYQSVADVTSLVQQHGSGVYRVGGVAADSFVNFDSLIQAAGWSLVVLYQLDGDPPRNLAVFDGLDAVFDAAGVSVTLDGFLVPDAAFDGKLGVLAYEGDNQAGGDQLSWDGNVLGNAFNPPDNFFNSTRSYLGVNAYVAGDLPQLTGEPQSTAGFDLDVVDITPYLSAGQTSAVVHAITTAENYYLGALITSVSTYKPDFVSSTKEAVDIDGGAVLAGDEIEYTIVVTNAGSDASVDTMLVDPLPSQVTLVPGSVEIAAGPNSGPKTDAPLDDQADYDAVNNTLNVRLGNGATAAEGGTLAVGGTTTVVFRVAIDAGASGVIENQATVSAAGAQGAPSDTTPTDGNGVAPGSPPTALLIDDCGSDLDCVAPEPRCDTAPDPNVCVECLEDADCPALEPVCDIPNHACICVVVGREVCGNDVDEDCSGSVDDGCGGGGGGGSGGAPGVGGAAGAGGSGGIGAGSSASVTGGEASTAGGDSGGLDFDGGSLEGGGCSCAVVRSAGLDVRALLAVALCLAAAVARRFSGRR